MPLNNFGFDVSNWDAAKVEAKSLLAKAAKNRQMIPYSDFVNQISSIRLKHNDERLAYFLGEISKEESAAGRGMLTALVVHKHGDYQPGPGFFDLAKKLGRNTSDIVKCWIDEVKLVFQSWDK